MPSEVPSLEEDRECYEQVDRMIHVFYMYLIPPSNYTRTLGLVQNWRTQCTVRTEFCATCGCVALPALKIDPYHPKSAENAHNFCLTPLISLCLLPPNTEHFLIISLSYQNSMSHFSQRFNHFLASYVHLHFSL